MPPHVYVETLRYQSCKHAPIAAFAHADDYDDHAVRHGAHDYAHADDYDDHVVRHGTHGYAHADDYVLLAKCISHDSVP
jgi:hypothetical protein